MDHYSHVPHQLLHAWLDRPESASDATAARKLGGLFVFLSRYQTANILQLRACIADGSRKKEFTLKQQRKDSTRIWRAEFSSSIVSDRNRAGCFCFPPACRNHKLALSHTKGPCRRDRGLVCQMVRDSFAQAIRLVRRQTPRFSAAAISSSRKSG